MEFRHYALFLQKFAIAISKKVHSLPFFRFYAMQFSNMFLKCCVLLVGNAFSKAALIQWIPGLALAICVSLKKGNNLQISKYVVIINRPTFFPFLICCKALCKGETGKSVILILIALSLQHVWHE